MLQVKLLISNFAWSIIMTINEVRGLSSTIKPTSSLTPSKARIAALKRTKDMAAQNLKAERDRQKLSKAQQTIASVKTSAPKI
jgi:hypothetical protein